jgi:penicillin-binding protein 2
MESRYRLRLFILTALVMIGVGTLLSRLYDFQIEKSSFFLKRVPGTRIETIREPGVRGEITDRNGIVLAENVVNYELGLNLEEIRTAWRQQMSERVAPGAPGEAAVTPDIDVIVEEFIMPRLRRHGLDPEFSPRGLRTHYITHRGLVLYPLEVKLTFEQFSSLAEHNLELPGVYASVRPRRHYPYKTLACHVLGYLKQWEKGDIPEGAREEYDHYFGDDVGMAGVEASMNDQLKGLPGRRAIRKDEKQNILGPAIEESIQPGQGYQVELTIDARAQFLVENVLRNAGRASAVVMNPETGEVLAMASVPNYNPNAFIPYIDREKYSDYLQNKAAPLLNRGIAPFTPGSTFKLPTAVTGCLHGKHQFRHSCSGSISYGRSGDVQIRCWKRTGHGPLEFAPAIQRSCNPYFMAMANSLGRAAMVDGFELLGFGEKTGIMLPGENPGILPGSLWWSREYRPGGVLTPSLVGQLAIGQGDSAATPLQMAALVACIANGGSYYRPRIVRRVFHPLEGLYLGDSPVLVHDLLEEGLRTEHLDIIRRGMRMAVNEPGGTARRAGLPTITVAGKTGTAQTVDQGRASYNAWTVAFAPFESPRYAVAVVVQGGKSGGSVAGPLVRMILHGLFARDEGLELPLAPMGDFAGNFEDIEVIVPPEDDLLPLAIDEEGETGDEASGADPDRPPVRVTPRVLPLPSLAPETDSGGGNAR